MTDIICFHNPDEENGYLSNWYPSRFVVNDVEFSSMEQYMMYRKACCFNDAETAARMLRPVTWSRSNDLADWWPVMTITYGMAFAKSKSMKGRLPNSVRMPNLGHILKQPAMRYWRNAPSKTASGALAGQCMTQLGSIQPNGAVRTCSDTF